MLFLGNRARRSVSAQMVPKLAAMASSQDGVSGGKERKE
jgi:hypothetical protein